MSAPLSIMIEAVQSRLAKEYLSTIVSGRDWNPIYASNAWIEPVTNTLMLEPAPVNPAWTTSNVGIYEKWFYDDFTSLTDLAHWLSAGQAADNGGPFMHYNGPDGNVAGLKGIGPVVAANTPICVEWYMWRTTQGSYPILDWGWSNTGDASDGVALRMFSDGTIAVWKDGYQVGTYGGGGTAPNYFDQQIAVGRMLGGGASVATAPGYQKLLAIPGRDRELIVVNSGGASFCHTFQDLPEGVADLVITPEATFWFGLPPNIQMELRFAEIQYQTEGNASGYPSAWRWDPPVGDPEKVLFQALSTVGLATISTSAPVANPYSVPNPVQIDVHLIGGPTSSPFVYGAQAYYAPSTASTPGPAVDLVPYALGCSLQVSDTIAGTQVHVTLNRPEALATAGVPSIRTMCNRPVQISDESGMFLDGQTEPPAFIEAFGIDADGLDGNREVELTIRDRWKNLEKAEFTDPMPLQGLSLKAAYTRVVTIHGEPAPYVSASADLFFLDSTPCSGGDWTVMCDVGDKGSEWVDKLHQTYAATWFHGYRPGPGGTPRLCLIDPADVTPDGLPSTPSLCLYSTFEEAIADGVDPDVAWTRVYRYFRRDTLEPEATSLSVCGRDPRGGKPIILRDRDTAMEAPGTAIGARPDNWVGSIWSYAWLDPGITTTELGRVALGYLKKRLTARREIGQVDCEYLPGVWRGDMIAVLPPGGDPGSDKIKYRVKTLNADFDLVASSDSHWRPARYVLEEPQEGLEAPLDVFGHDISTIKAHWHALRPATKHKVKHAVTPGQATQRRPPIQIQGH